MSSRRAALDRFYELLAEVERECGGNRRLADCNARTGWPQRGVYFFFEAGEFREDGVRSRVVRVGTHGLNSRSRTTLWNRLSQHKGCTGGSLPGGGNHRSSIFRRHVGTALLASGSWPESTRNSWCVGTTASSELRRAEHAVERAVTDHIGRMSLLWLDVGDPAGPESDRAVIEAGSIALLSNLRIPAIVSSGSGDREHRLRGRRSEATIVAR